MIAGAVPLVKGEIRSGVYILTEGETIRYVGASQYPYVRAMCHRIHIPHDKRLFIPVRGPRSFLLRRESELIAQLRPSHNRKDNPEPKIESSVTTQFRDSQCWRLWTNRDLSVRIRRAAKEAGKTPHEWMRFAIEAAVETARGRGLGIKTPPTSRDGRRKTK
jgi:hypothetical protein